ncbi:MAG TPA: hypothetical protein VHO92_03800 [Methanobacterium sp.]|nr:hypothetical protein [Methanobacterium sp.]
MKRKITMPICAVIIVLVITGSYFVNMTNNKQADPTSSNSSTVLAATSTETTTANSNGGTVPEKPNGNSTSTGSAPGGPGNGQSQDNSANVVTPGAYVIDGTIISSNSFNDVLKGFLGIFGMEWYSISETGKTYTSTESNQSAVVVNGSGSLSIDSARKTKWKQHINWISTR